MVIVSAQVESELVDLEEDDKREFLESLGAFRQEEVDPERPLLLCGLRVFI